MFFLMIHVKTGNGKVGIEFIDDTRVDVTEHSKLVIDEFVYDPNTKTGSLSLKATLGTVRYAQVKLQKLKTKCKDQYTYSYDCC